MRANNIETLENYLIQMDANYETLEEGLWVVQESGVKVVIKSEGDIVFFRINLFSVPGGDQLALFKKLLELNSTSMVLGAYGLEDNKVVIIDSLTTENIDLNEFQASIESISLAAVENYKEIKALLNE